MARPAMPAKGDLRQLVDYLLGDSNSPHVVVSPLVWREDVPDPYVIVCTSEAERGWRSDQIVVKDEATRSSLIVALATTKPPLVIHDMDDEVETARLCETLWPGERITRVRKALEKGRLN